MLATNYRCPATVVAASAQIVAVNRERFAKPIRAPAGSPVEADAITAWDTARPDSADAHGAICSPRRCRRPKASASCRAPAAS